MKYHILYNPAAGTCHTKEPEKLDTLFEGAEKTDVTKLEDYSGYVRSLTEEDTLVICGGDGTLNHFVNQAPDASELKCNVLYYAAGTGNDFLHDIGAEADKPICINEYIKELPTVTVNGKELKFINGIGFGIDGYCCEVGDKLRAKSDKPVNYTSIAIKGLLFHFKPVNAKVTVDGVTYEYKKVWIAPTMNGRMYGGGMIPTPQQDRLNKERSLSTMIFHGSGKIKTLMIFPSLFKGEHIKKEKNISIHRGFDITVEFDRPCALQVDGETVLGVTSYRVRSYALTKNEQN